MVQTRGEEWYYNELRRRAVAMFGDERANELEEYIRTTARQISDVEAADVHRDREPMVQG